MEVEKDAPTRSRLERKDIALIMARSTGVVPEVKVSLICSLKLDRRFVVKRQALELSEKRQWFKQSSSSILSESNASK